MSHNLRSIAAVGFVRSSVGCHPVLGLWIVMALCVASAPGQTVVTIVTPTNGARFQKAVGMELNIELQATVTPTMENQRVYFYANGNVVGSAHTIEGFTTVWSNVNFGTYDLLAGTGPGPAGGQPVTIHVETNGVALINESAWWQYLDGGLDPGPGWMDPAFDTTAWPTGVPQFGFGDNDEQTILYIYNPINSTAFPAYYFKHTFTVTNTSSWTNALIRLLRDDGAIVYLNGHEVIRDNMPAGVVSNGTYAVSAALDENEFTDWHINPGRLLEGSNHIAAEVHNASPFNHDISFDLRLLANTKVLPPPLAVERRETNVILKWPRSYPGYALEESASLTNPDWRRSTNTFSTSTGFRSTNTAAGSNRFFRLRIQ